MRRSPKNKTMRETRADKCETCSLLLFGAFDTAALVHRGTAVIYLIINWQAGLMCTTDRVDRIGTPQGR